VIDKSKQISIPNIPFNAPIWCVNGHVHTIGSSLFRRSPETPFRRLQIDTPDGDFLIADWSDSGATDQAVLLLHGLEGSSERYYIRELMHAFFAQGYSVLALNFRGCLGPINKKRRFYHSGETSDLSFIAHWLRKEKQIQHLAAVGFSLGGNVLLKYLGERGSQSVIDAAVAVSVPYDLKVGSLRIGRGINKIYQHYFLRSLNKKLKMKRNNIDDIPHFTGRTLYDFDDQITSKLHGFSNAEEYYRTCSSQRFLSEISKPSLLIHAHDDPLCEMETVPLQTINKNSYLKPLMVKQGGHVGFWSTPRGWLRSITTRFVNQMVN